MHGITIKSPGFYTTIQDSGRLGYRSVGVPLSGVMDRYAYRLSNYILGNNLNEAVLEATMVGPEIEFSCETVFSLTGADMSATLNNEKLKPWSSFYAKEGDVLKLSRASSGMRSYISFRGGIDVPEVFGSKSTYEKARIGGLSGRALKSYDFIKLRKTDIRREYLSRKFLSSRYIPKYTSDISLRVVLGPQLEKFTDKGRDIFLNEEFNITSKNDRMGYRLSGEKIESRGKTDIISDGLYPGAIQISNSGDPIIMMADCQTVGGYAKIGYVITADLPKIAQAKAGDKVRFESISLENAQKDIRWFHL
jgi:antagonist of KipI